MCSHNLTVLSSQKINADRLRQRQRHNNTYTEKKIKIKNTYNRPCRVEDGHVLLCHDLAGIAQKYRHVESVCFAACEQAK